MRDNNLSGIILEGIAGTGKTTALYELLKSDHWHKKPFLSSVILSEHHTLRVLENKRLENAHTNKDSIDLLNYHTDYLAKLNENLAQTSWLKRDRTAQKVPFILERFHLSHVYHHSDLEWADVVPVENKLKTLNAKLLLFTIHTKDIKTRIIEDYNKAGWQNYLKTLGNNERELVDYFTQKQDELLGMSKKTSLETILIDSSKMSTKEIVEKIFTEWNL